MSLYAEDMILRDSEHHEVELPILSDPRKVQLPVREGHIEAKLLML